MEDVEQCDLSGMDFAVNATLHDNDASFAFDEKCKEQGITVVHTVNLGKAAIGRCCERATIVKHSFHGRQPTGSRLWDAFNKAFLLL